MLFIFHVIAPKSHLCEAFPVTSAQKAKSNILFGVVFMRSLNTVVTV